MGYLSMLVLSNDKPFSLFAWSILTEHSFSEGNEGVPTVWLSFILFAILSILLILLSIKYIRKFGDQQIRGES